MKKTGSHLFSTLFGIALATVFLVLTFRNTSFDDLISELSRVGWADTALVFALSLTMMLTRGFRWWLLLPAPRRPGEHWAAQRATAISYGVNNVASRVGELVRIFFFKRDTGRDLGSVTTTVMADRLVFDLMPFALIFGVTLMLFRAEIAAISPRVEQVFPLFMLVLFFGMIGLAVLALRPLFFSKILSLLGLRRFPGLWQRVDHLIADLSTGLQRVARPRAFISISLYNVLIWVVSVIYYYFAVRAFGIGMDVGQMLLVFSVSSLGVVVPSPGGVGSVHFFMSAALISFLETPETVAAAAAAYAHGVNYLTLTAGALFFLLVPPKKVSHETIDP